MNHLHLPANAGRESTRRLPKISKHIQACTECHRRKIKCNLRQGESICGRCQQRGLRCIVNKNLQTILQDDAQWKSQMEHSSRRLQAAVSEILRNLELPALETFSSSASEAPFSIWNPAEASTQEIGDGIPVPGQCTPALAPGQFRQGAREASQNIKMAITGESSQEYEVADESGDSPIIAVPMGSLYEVTKLRNLRSDSREYLQHKPMTTTPEHNDIISTGTVSNNEAQELFHVFTQSLNQYLWGGIVLVHQDLLSIRCSSSLLLVAILAVTALHVPGRSSIFDICYAEFNKLVRESMLDRSHTLDSIRGLCIAAFWLPDVSWKLSGHAVRIATEMNLHQSYAQVIKGSHEHFEGARLWYLLYVCDHHFSIAYGRPPVILDDSTILLHENFLQVRGITQADQRLHSQVALFIILTQIYAAFGPDLEQNLEEEDLGRLRGWNIEIDRWRLRWEPQLAPNHYISSYPSKGVNLHYYFAKLQLNSLSLRGFHQLSPKDMSANRQEHANIAISCAMTILQLVINEPDMRNALNGVPLYIHTMITYAAVFLLKMQQQLKTVCLVMDYNHTIVTVNHIIDILNGVKASDRHLSYRIAGGLKRMLGGVDQSIGSYPEIQSELARQENDVLGTTSHAGNAAAHLHLETEDQRGYGKPRRTPEEEIDNFFDGSFPKGLFEISVPWQWQSDPIS